MAALPTIAIVNDDIIYLDLLKSYFEDKEFRVLLAEPNGKVFLSKLAGCNELPDICILDTDMPVMNGFETAIALLRQYPQIKILAIPAVHEEYVVARMRKIGIKSIVRKDKGLSELILALMVIKQSGWYMDEETSTKCMSGYYKKLMLTDKEECYLGYNAKGLCIKEIASEMDITRSSVDKYRRKVCRKLRVLSRNDLTAYASRLGLSSAAVG